ncbi:uncharacterized protein LOC129942695 [Eupeodes corollae]|uniref:uncharacterized protein LOC129942695 n=1 Tax=Eupeodes corollae TaxID=290404 RepID=UPI002491E139|nr:uncharacterized protein LOC129942695 [Eupeodes corollae]
MDAKILVALFIVVNCYSSCGAALRRTPKVYNALITTDENLTSSRAYPVIQPTIHETGIASYPYGPYNPYGLYSNSLLRFAPPIVPGLSPRSQLPYPFQQPGLPAQRYQPPQPQFPQEYPTPEEHQLPPSGPSESLPPSGPSPSLPPSGPPSGPELEPPSQNEVIPPPSAPASESAPIPIQEPKPPQVQPSEKLPIPLNEFGLPPSLVPLQPYPPQRNRQPLPLNFSPYPYQNFPVLYEPYNRFQDHFLPPYDYFPHNSFGISGAGAEAAVQTTPAPPTPEPSKAPIIPPQPPQPEPTTPAPAPPTEVTTQVPLESIKNGSPNKNADVPDVPPPPIPSGANSTNKA